MKRETELIIPYNMCIHLASQMFDLLTLINPLADLASEKGHALRFQSTQYKYALSTCKQHEI